MLKKPTPKQRYILPDKGNIGIIVLGFFKQVVGGCLRFRCAWIAMLGLQFLLGIGLWRLRVGMVQVDSGPQSFVFKSTVGARSNCCGRLLLGCEVSCIRTNPETKHPVLNLSCLCVLSLPKGSSVFRGAAVRASPLGGQPRPKHSKT